MNKKRINPELQQLIEKLQRIATKEGVCIWKHVARELSGSTKKKPVVNISRINRYAQQNETVVIPGKVLASGELTVPIHVAAFKFSREAREKIKHAKGKALSISELLEENPKGKEVRIIG